ncbi:solute carrier organic anion transporter family member 2A1-like [Dreissena polymorpha]|uniref:solute carrier organic anion transporter family member 2A1-like n=1 Tax=Dreissena polymorpha TaxID=45954 RepID=UPI002264B2E1|nr:solute carrier organic anion transporter family member 2A1-like [Dreissena polymorpha]
MIAKSSPNSRTVFVTRSLWTLTVSQVSIIEKAFGLSSSETGWLFTIWEIGYVICTVFASYFGPRVHQTRAIGFFNIVCGLSAFLFALPHFVAFKDGVEYINGHNRSTGLKTDDFNADKLCAPHQNTSALDKDMSDGFGQKKVSAQSNKVLAFALFNVAMILQGVGKAPCYPYSAQYVDDNVDQAKTGFYIETPLSSKDPRYIGAWWLGFIILGVATLAISVPMFFFPRRLGHDKTDQMQKVAASASSHREVGTLKAELKYVAVTLLSIGKSIVYVFTLIAACFNVLSVSIFLGFEPKYMETQFSVPSSTASIFVGVMSIAALSIGTLLGGVVTRRGNTTPFRLILTIIGLWVTVTMLLAVAMVLGCGSQTVFNPLNNDTLAAALPCSCNHTEFLPICSEGVSYFSPCHAGCTNTSAGAFSACTLIPSGSAVGGLCGNSCGMLWPYSVVKFVLNLVDAIASIPIFLVFLRSAGEERKALALGVSAAVISLGAWLPGPVIGGKLIDSSCLFWNTASTSARFCAHYDIADQRYKLYGTMIGMRLVGVLISLVSLVSARKLKSWGHQSAQEDKNMEELVVQHNLRAEI